MIFRSWCSSFTSSWMRTPSLRLLPRLPPLHTTVLFKMASTATSDGAPTIQRIKVEMTSDAICPFCYLGYKNFNIAVSQAKSSGIPLDYDLEFKPFLLDPTLGSESVVKRDRYKQKFGEAKVEPMEKMMIERGKKVGIEFSYGGNLSQTHDYHRIMAYAYKIGQEDLQRTLAEAFFHGYFEAEQDVGQRPYLIRTSIEKGVFPTEDEAKKWFESEEQWSEVKMGYKTAQQMGINGVPFFVLDNKYAISGAQPPAAFVEVFGKLAEMRGLKADDTTSATKDGEARAIDGNHC